MAYIPKKEITNGNTNAPPTKKQIEKGKQNHLISEEQWKESIMKCYGITSWIARDLGVSYQNVTEKLSRNPDLRQLKIDAHEALIDNMEEKMLDLANAKNYDAIRYIMSHQGKDRGWGDSLDINTKSMNLNVNLNLMEKMTPEELEVWNRQHRNLLDATDQE
jgi:hypothetical protein